MTDICDCDLRDRQWNPNTGACETCRRRYKAGAPTKGEKALAFISNLTDVLNEPLPCGHALVSWCDGCETCGQCRDEKHAERAADTIARLTRELEKMRDQLSFDHVVLVAQREEILAAKRERDEARAEVERLRAEMRTMLTPCEHARLMAEASDPVLREQMARLRDFVNDTTMVQYHGCVTGDCPHGNERDCVEPLREELQRIGQAAEEALTGKRGASDEEMRLRAIEEAAKAWLTVCLAGKAAGGGRWDYAEEAIRGILAGTKPGDEPK